MAAERHARTLSVQATSRWSVGPPLVNREASARELVLHTCGIRKCIIRVVYRLSHARSNAVMSALTRCGGSVRPMPTAWGCGFHHARERPQPRHRTDTEPSNGHAHDCNARSRHPNCTSLQHQALWDGVASLSTLTRAMDRAELSSRQLDVGPGETKLLCFAPLATAAELLRWTSDDRNTARNDNETPCGGCAAADVGEAERRELQWRTIAWSATGLCVALLWVLLSTMMLAPRSSSCSQDD